MTVMNKETQARQLLKIWRDNPIKFVKDVFNVEPDEWQCDVLMDFAKYNRIAMKASKGVGKEQPYSVIIPTPNGPTEFGKLQIGDFVFGDDGLKTKITNIFEQGEKDVYQITFDDGTSTKCGLDHLWKVRGITEKRKKTWSVISTKEILDRGLTVDLGKSGKYYQFQIPNCKPADYSEKKYDLHPYALGVWLGDGTKKTASYTKTNDEICEKLNQFGVKTVKNNSKFRYTMSSIQQKLRDLGLFDKNSCERFIPDIYQQGSAEQRLQLLRGLMDTDGTARPNSPTTEFNTTSLTLAKNIVSLAQSLGAKSWIKNKVKKGKYKKNDKIVICKDCYRVTITMEINPFLTKQKASLWRKPTQSRYTFKTIKSIKKIGVENSRCIVVDNASNCYLTNDFIVTHNSTILSWVAWNFLVTRPHPKIAATSISFDNLADGLWTEMAKWRGVSPLLQYQFEWTKTRIFSKEHPETWYMSARTYPKTGDSNSQANTLAGLHADYLLFILDEVGGIPDGVMAAAEAGLASGVETKIIMAGNPTHLEGPLYRAVTSEKHLWKVTEITSDPDNPKRSPRVSIEWAKEQREKYGADSPWYIVNVLGKFPPSSINSLLGPDEVSAAMKRGLKEQDYSFSQKRLGVDVARFGMDKTVIFPRQGLRAFKPAIMSGSSTSDIAARVAEAKFKWGAEVISIDGTGGFGAGVVDQLRTAGITCHEIHFSSKATDQRFFNKRSEMWFKMAEWIKKGGCLPNIPELARELTAPQYTFNNGKFQLEPKDDIKDRIGFSPDMSDALALSFFMNDMPSEMAMRENPFLYKRNVSKLKVEDEQ